MQIKKTKPSLNVQLPSWTIPLFFLLETIIAYGIFAGLQGFYFDDWPIISQIHLKANIWEFLVYDRPVSAWTLYLTAPILGTNALAWHLFTISTRWLTTWSAWFVLNQIWPKQKRVITLIAMLFAVYPAFVQMPIAVTYSQHFLTYLLFLLSFAFMFISLTGGKRKFWIFTLLSLMTQGLQLFTLEYFWGPDLLRFLALYFYFDQRETSTFKARVYKVGKLWLPYLLVFISAIIWRLYIYAPADDPNELRLLAMLQANPLSTILHFVEIVLKDVLYIIVTAWEKTLQVNLIDLQNRFSSFVWLVVIGLATGLVFYFNSLSLKVEDNLGSWRKQLFTFGLAIVLLGPLPAWMTNKQITVGMYSDRFALASMLGAAIILVTFLDWVLSTKKQVVISVAILVGLAVGLHIRTANEYRWAWVNQQRFFWQMHWRVPDLEANTPIFSDGAIFQYTGDYPTAFALNLLYPPNESDVTKFSYWFFELDSGFHRYPKQYLNGQTMEGQLRNISFSGSSLDSILVTYNSAHGNCLWVAGEGDEMIYSLSSLTQQALPLSNLDRINPLPETPPDNNLFGKEIEHTWCYYFQKAELARQMGDWEGLNELTEEVIEKGFSPQNNFEWRPFVDGYLHNENYGAAYDLSLETYQRTEETHDMLCSMWITHFEKFPEDTALGEHADLIDDQLRCPW